MKLRLWQKEMKRNEKRRNPEDIVENENDDIFLEILKELGGNDNEELSDKVKNKMDRRMIVKRKGKGMDSVRSV